ncbi:MAG TPA: LysR substrate-binding domain-containing protein [Pirellulales bacterium]|nr:LysR substrate-binding domain-containing protein [Pirellulales bacterium]
MSKFFSISTDQVAALVEVARQGNLRRAADVLHISEQGVRNRLVALERRLGVQLYHKRRGMRRSTPLTVQGRQFLPHATAFLERARELADRFRSQPVREVHVAASQYLILYGLVAIIRRFHAAAPQIQIRLRTRTEREIEAELLSDPDVALGIAAPHEPAHELDYHHLFSMNWSLITPPRHPLLKKKRIRLRDLANQPLIFFERNSTGRQHVIDAFHLHGLSPRVEMEATTTEIIVRMVEAGLGLSIVPLLSNGIVTRGRAVATKSLGNLIRPIHSGILVRRGETPSPAAQQFIDFVKTHWPR